MLGQLFIVFIIACVLFFIFSLFYSHFVKTREKRLENDDNTCYNESNED